MPHPGKLRLRQGRWNLSELDSASSDGTSSCRASLVLSLHTCVHVRHTVIHVCTHTHTNTCFLLRLCMHLLLHQLCRHIYNANQITFPHTRNTAREYQNKRNIYVSDLLRIQYQLITTIPDSGNSLKYSKPQMTYILKCNFRSLFNGRRLMFASSQG